MIGNYISIVCDCGQSRGFNVCILKNYCSNVFFHSIMCPGGIKRPNISWLQLISE